MSTITSTPFNQKNFDYLNIFLKVGYPSSDKFSAKTKLFYKKEEVLNLESIFIDGYVETEKYVIPLGSILYFTLVSKKKEK